jgi:MbtH protein
MENPFEVSGRPYFALINEEGQYSLWPAFIEVPDGWEIVHGEASRESCLEYISDHWTDMRPNSLIRAMEGAQAGQ